MAAYLIARSKKHNTIGEELVLPIAVKISEILMGKYSRINYKIFRC